MFTELDLNILPNRNISAGAEIHQNYQYDKEIQPLSRDGLDKAMTKKFEDRYLEFFRIYRQHASQISPCNPLGCCRR